MNKNAFLMLSGENYSAPKVTIVDMSSEGMMCTSPDATNEEWRDEDYEW